MDRRLLAPKWLLAHTAVLALAGAFVSLGVWQLDRLGERKAVNEVGAERFALDPVPFGSLEGESPDAIEYRRVTVSGRVLSDREVLVRSQTYLGSAGYHLIVPVSHAGGSVVLINRGWVPLGTEVGTTDHGTDDGQTLTVQGWIHTTQERRGVGPVDEAEGVLEVMSRVDIERIEQQMAPGVAVADVYIVELGEEATKPPFPIDPPDFTDEGPHLSYAVQWFGFTLVLMVGYIFLARSRLRASA